jgi:hypothetical protein
MTKRSTYGMRAVGTNRTARTVRTVRTVRTIRTVTVRWLGQSGP